jgi:2-polyprenyl-3-methyl-5-hydroxy-6-metoxy-1,4-benzoquinol methylase
MNHAYKRNYDQIARDHIRHWRTTGRNPFQEEGTLQRNENETFELLKQYLQPGARVLDAGCGMGDMLLRLGGYDAVGIDLSTDYVQVGRERGLDVRVGRIEKLPWPREHFDMVICTDVLEHVLDLNKAVRELLRVLKPGGTMIVRTPNKEELPFDTPPYEYVHLRRFDHATFHLLFRKIFPCEVLETIERADVINVAVRK